MSKTIIILVAAALLTACTTPRATPTSTPVPVPTSVPGPTSAPLPTLVTLTLPITATMDVKPVVAAPQVTAGPELNCKVLQQSVKAGSRYKSKEHFDISWMIQNTGTASWEPGAVVLAYAGGTKMYWYQPVQLTHSSPPHDIVILNADMVAPRTPDTYTMYWSLRRGDEYFCRLRVTISVHL